MKDSPALKDFMESVGGGLLAIFLGGSLFLFLYLKDVIGKIEAAALSVSIAVISTLIIQRIAKWHRNNKPQSVIEFEQGISV